MDEKEVKVAYQNKDIVSKIFGEAMKEKSLKAYGLNVPKVVDVLPTNLPALELNELRIDNIFVNKSMKCKCRGFYLQVY